MVAGHHDQDALNYRSRRRHVWTILAGASLAFSACGLEPGSGLCTETSLFTPPIRVVAPLAPLTFTATLTADQKPITGAELIFFVRRVSQGQTGTRDVTFSVGSSTTGADGVARYIRKGGIDGLMGGNGRLTGYEVAFRPVAKVGGVQYCRAASRGELTVG